MSDVPGSRVALVDADAAFHARLRARFGQVPSSRALALPKSLAYCGADYRVYPFMRIADAVRFFSAMHDTWDAERLESDFELARLDGSFEIRRMKRAYQRALVLAIAAAARPAMLVVENGEEFDDGPPAELLFRAVARTPSVIVTFGDGGARPEADGNPFGLVAAADTFELRTLS